MIVSTSINSQLNKKFFISKFDNMQSDFMSLFMMGIMRADKYGV